MSSNSSRCVPESALQYDALLTRCKPHLLWGFPCWSSPSLSEAIEDSRCCGEHCQALDLRSGTAAAGVDRELLPKSGPSLCPRAGLSHPATLLLPLTLRWTRGLLLDRSRMGVLRRDGAKIVAAR